MADIALAAGIGVQPVLITVDPERDTLEEMAKELAERASGVCRPDRDRRGTRRRPQIIPD